jgi:hypothetical protein
MAPARYEFVAMEPDIQQYYNIHIDAVYSKAP